MLGVISTERAKDDVVRPPNDGAVSQSAVRITSLTRRFPSLGGRPAVVAVDDVSLDIGSDEFVVLLGPSGCGKTTLLRSIAGLEHPDAGTIDLFGNRVFDASNRTDVPPERRNVGMVFQTYALWPHMTVFENVAYPLRARHVPRKDVRERVEQVLEKVGVGQLVDRYPSQMSGGQQQRVALARALVGNAKLVLFDEPLSNVDAQLRERLRVELLTLQREIGFAALYVTHDQADAMEFADRIAVMKAGQIVQLGGPRAVYEQPESPYVATFVGTSNEAYGRVTAVDDGLVVAQCEFGVARAEGSGEPLAVDDEVVLIWRPERCSVSVDEPSSPNRWPATVERVLFLGSHTEHVVRAGTTRFRVWSQERAPIAEGTSVWISIDVESLRVFRRAPIASS